MMEMRTLKTRRFKAGYVIHYGEWYMDSDTGWVPMRWAETPEGWYIGTSRIAHRLCVTKGIRPELAHPGDSVCSIGYSRKTEKWWGWSHRAWYGFGIGDEVEPGDVIATQFPIGFKAKTMEDAKKMAIAFAEEVS